MTKTEEYIMEAAKDNLAFALMYKVKRGGRNNYEISI